MYEPRHTPPVPQAVYIRRVINHLLAAAAMACGSLLVGMWGFHHFEELGWLDAFTNAAMLLGGEGPLEQPHSIGGKAFAGLYAIYSGIVFIAIAGVVVAPVAHRVLHRFHWKADR